MAIKSKGRGKSGGARVITHLVAQVFAGEEGPVSVYLLSIYDKSELDSISDRELKLLIKELLS